MKQLRCCFEKVPKITQLFGGKPLSNRSLSFPHHAPPRLCQTHSDQICWDGNKRESKRRLCRQGPVHWMPQSLTLVALKDVKKQFKNQCFSRKDDKTSKSKTSSLAGVTLQIKHQPVNPKITGSIPSQGTRLGCEPGPQYGACKR